MIAESIRLRVAEHFGHRCAYCQAPLFLMPGSGQIEHIVPQFPDGDDGESNLCLACTRCNLRKGARTTATDPVTWQVVPLFHPRRQRWSDHFEWSQQGAIVLGRTACGRATVATLKMNENDMIRARRFWILAGWHPPEQP